jgi:hypothetical protein
MSDKLSIEDLEQLAHELYEAWIDDMVKVQEKYDKYLKVKERLDEAKGLTQK